MRGMTLLHLSISQLQLLAFEGQYSQEPKSKRKRKKKGLLETKKRLKWYCRKGANWVPAEISINFIKPMDADAIVTLTSTNQIQAGDELQIRWEEASN